MKGKNIIITGASSGIGKATAQYLAEQGAKVILVARRENELKKIVGQIGRDACYYVCDLSRIQDIQGIFQYCESQGILLDALVHSAGIAKPIPVRTTTHESVQEMMQINCMSFMELGKLFYNRKYSRKGAAIVAISSMAAIRPIQGQASYAASKSALNSMVEVMSQEFLKRKIRVNSIMPTYVDTPLVGEGTSYGMNEGIHDMPLGVIEPEQIAYLVEFLLSDKAAHITGAAIPVTSGV